MNNQYLIRLMDEMIPSVVKDFFAVFTPYLLAITEVVPTGIAIFSGVVGAMHLWKKYKLTSLQLKQELEKEKEKAKQ